MSHFPLIRRPKRKSEFDIQAELFFLLKREKFEVYGEVSARNKGRKSIFDLVVFHGQDAAVIIEVKNSPYEALLNGKMTRQSKKYNEYGIPAIFHTTLTSLEETLNKVRAAIDCL